MTDIYAELKRKTLALMQDNDLMDATVRVEAHALSVEEAIGNPEADDFPIQKGKERLMQADIQGGLGQAFTDRFGNYEGRLETILSDPLENNYRRAIFIAALNAVLRHLGKVGGTVHCHDEEPVRCARALVEHIQERFGTVKITQVGLQPRMVESLAARFPMRVLDMDPDNIGTRKYGPLIESPDTAHEALDWADLLLVTGSTIVNGSLQDFLGPKPVIFYGTTLAGAAHLMGWDLVCACSTRNRSPGRWAEMRCRDHLAPQADSPPALPKTAVITGERHGQVRLRHHSAGDGFTSGIVRGPYRCMGPYRRCGDLEYLCGRRPATAHGSAGAEL